MGVKRIDTRLASVGPGFAEDGKDKVELVATAERS
jgi:hypothetical protein